MIFHCLLWTSRATGLVLVEHGCMHKMLCFFFVSLWYIFLYMHGRHHPHAHHTGFHVCLHSMLSMRTTLSFFKSHVSFMPQAFITTFSLTTIFLSHSYPLYLGCFTSCPIHAHYVYYHSSLPFLQATPLNPFLYPPHEADPKGPCLWNLSKASRGRVGAPHGFVLDETTIKTGMFKVVKETIGR